MTKNIHSSAIIKKLQIINKNQKGSFTIEASLVFPIILLLTVALILISVFIYEQVYLYYIAVTTAERTTYSWNNSGKDPVTGEFALGSYDDLYWRLTDDQLFGFFTQSMKSDYSLKVIKEKKGSTDSKDSTGGLSYVNKSNSLAEKKLYNSLALIPIGINGSSIYINNIADKRISIYLENPIKISPPLEALIGDKISANASSTITDPVDFIRTTDLIISNMDRLDKREEAKTVLSKKKK